MSAAGSTLLPPCWPSACQSWLLSSLPLLLLPLLLPAHRGELWCSSGKVICRASQTREQGCRQHWCGGVKQSRQQQRGCALCLLPASVLVRSR